MSLNSLESEGLRPPHFLSFAHLDMSAQVGPGHWMLEATDCGARRAGLFVSVVSWEAA